MSELSKKYQLIAEAIQIGMFYPMMQAFMESVQEWETKIDSTFRFDDMALEYDLTEVLDLDIKRDTREYLEYVIYDESRDLLSNYFGKVMNKAYNHHEIYEGTNYKPERDLRYYGLDDLWTDVLTWVETETESNSINGIEENDFDISFCMDKRTGIGKYPFGAKIYTVPIIYLMYRPFDDWSISSSLIADMKIALKGDDPISFEELSKKMSKYQQSKIDPYFLYHLAINNFQFLTIKENGSIKVDLSEEIIPPFFQLKETIDPKDYLLCDSSRFRLEWKDRLHVRRKSLLRKMEIGQYSKYSSKLVYRELGFKLAYDYEKNRPLTKVSAADKEKIINKAIEYIRSVGRPVSFNEIITELGIDDLPFEPKTLGPGELMAYATNKEHLKRANSRYVTKDMVGTRGDMRGKIPSTRVVTPFEERDYSFSKDFLRELIVSDEAFTLWGLVDTLNISHSIAQGLDIPTREIFYIEKIHKKVISFLPEIIQEELQVLDPHKKRFYIRTGCIQGIERKEGEVRYRWMQRVAEHITGINGLSGNEITRLGEPYSSRINALLGREKQHSFN